MMISYADLDDILIWNTSELMCKHNEINVNYIWIYIT